MPFTSYATNVDIAAEFKNAINLSTGALTAAQVDEFCIQATNTIHGYISGKWQVPVDIALSPQSYSILKMLCIQLVVPRVAAATGVQTGIAKSSQTPGGGKGAGASDPLKAAKDMLKDIQSGTMQLPDGVLATGADGVKSYTNDNADTLQPPVFQRGKKNW